MGWMRRRRRRSVWGFMRSSRRAALDEIERFFLERGAEVMHEVCPFAGTATLDLLCSRGYRAV